MPITNKLNLPDPIILALQNDSYNPGDGDFSCTQLIKAPKISVLEKRHKDEIFEDASDLLYSLTGQALHAILERSGMKSDGYKVENRHYAQYGRWKVSAQYDCFFVDGFKLYDYKQCTTYAFKVKDGKIVIKPEWFSQLNIQADILRRDIGADIRELYIVGFLRDWQPGKAATDPLYPQNQIVMMSIPMATPERTEKYVLERCALHQAAMDCPDDDAIPECNQEERWQDETKYAVMKIGGKRSIKNFEDRTEAEKFIAGSSDAAKLTIEERPGFPRHCMGIGLKVYCKARHFCHYYRNMVANHVQEENRE